MNYFRIDLYAHFGLQKEPGAAGFLRCYVQDAYDRLSPNRRFPAMLVLPGGGYAGISTRELEPIAFQYLAAGFCSFVLEYSCAPVRFPAALREAVMAMRYIRENADTLRVAPEEIAALGFSAGGHLCGTLGTLYDCPEVSDLVTGTQARPNALVLCYPVLVEWGKTNEGTFKNLTGTDTELRRRLSVDKLVRPDMPPVFLWHTRDDEGVPVRNSLIMAEELDKAGVDFAMHIYRHGTHGLSLGNDYVYPVGQIPEHSGNISEWVGDTLEFFREIGLTIED